MMNELIKLIEGYSIEDLLLIDMESINWVWINEEIFSDIINNISELNDYQESDLETLVSSIDKNRFINSIRNKMKQKGWLEVNQFFFTEIDKEFIPTTDIETYVFVNRKYFISRMNKITSEMEWVFKAMAIDTFQHLLSEESLTKIYDEYFSNNYMLIEDLLVKEEYCLNQGKWHYYKNNGTLVFYKNSKKHRQWSEGSTISTYNELNR
ncbi:hypothetical protein [Alkaliphilus peptidifermentans]|uniref:Uncharacterized protein n=1 Tax=Alkaliphilus peptidifermentans DSM 18978 TaxID=1120976 RepID=A0A1G5CM35_9FIRM|nr:hypothetical protein [Alkaliphilus peptidifermentans]SCY03331.1 hypothetical protein SAMN03080606_00701 [Alkaliphilus peptidifermentans DSM 18978]